MDAIDLAALDDAPPVDLDPLLWSANLSALRAEQPDLARQVEDAPLPSHWRPAAALDGFLTYRTEPANQSPQWLAGTAAPLTRAGALLRYDQIGDRNPALPTIAAGAELKLLLERLPPQHAVFVFEEELTRLAVVLRTVDLARALTTGRCVLVPPGREQTFLEQLLERHPGLLPPRTIVPLPPVTGERLVRLRNICESVARQTGETRNQRVQSLAARVSAGPPSQDGRRDARPTHLPRLAVLALGSNPASHHLSDELAKAAGKLNWTICHCTATGPRKAHALPHCEQIADFAAELSICIDHPPAALPLRPGRIVCQWHLHAKDVAEQLPSDDTIHLAATPRVARTLEGAGVPTSRLIDFYWAYPLMYARVDSPPRSRRTVVVVADLPDASPAACRIEQPTHKQLWAQLHQTAAKAWETPEITQPATLLRTAEGVSGVELGESSLRKQMVRIIEHVLIPAVVLERILQLLQQESFEVVTVGAGWHGCRSESLQPIADNLERLPEEAAAISPLGAIFAGPLDPLSPGLFRAAALGWPLLIHSPRSASLSPWLGGILHPQQHYDPFAGAHELLAALRTIQTNPERAERRCTRVRAYLKQQHTYAQRLTTLVRRLELKWPETAA